MVMSNLRVPLRQRNVYQYTSVSVHVCRYICMWGRGGKRETRISVRSRLFAPKALGVGRHKIGNFVVSNLDLGRLVSLHYAL